MFAEHIGCASGLGNAQADARGGEASLRAIEFAVNAFFHAFGDRKLHFVGGFFSFLKPGQTLFPLGEFGIA